MIKSSTFVVFLCLLVSNSFAQPTLEEAFDDSGSKLDLSLGTNLFRFAYGTPNLGLSLVYDERWWLYAEAGVSPFSFREREINYTPESGNIFGQEACFELAYRSPWGYDDRSSHYIIGVGVQAFEYTSVKNDELMFIKHGISSDESSATYFFQTADESLFQFDRKFLGFGGLFGADFSLSKRFSMTYFLMLGAMSSSVRYDADTSYGITWPKEEPSGYQSSDLLFFTKMTVGLFYKLN